MANFTAELFQSKGNGKKRRSHHAPHSSIASNISSTSNRSYKIGNSMKYNAHQHQPHGHQHNNSEVSNSNYHRRKGTGNGSRHFENEFNPISRDIPSQKNLMKDWLDQRVSRHLEQESSNFIDQIHDYDMGTSSNTVNTYPHHYSGTLTNLGMVTTPLDENDVIEYDNFNPNLDDIEIEDYTDSEDDEIDPMKQLGDQLTDQLQKLPHSANNSQNDHKNDNKNKPGRHRKQYPTINDGFPDTHPVKNMVDNQRNQPSNSKNKKTNRTPLSNGDYTPQSVVFHKSDAESLSDDSDNDTYESDNDDGEAPKPKSFRKKQTKQPKPKKQQSAGLPNNKVGHKQFNRSATNTNLRAAIPKKKNGKHRHSQSELPMSSNTIKKDALYQAWARSPGGNASLTKAFFGNAVRDAKDAKENRERVKHELEKEFKPQLQKTMHELEEARTSLNSRDAEVNKLKHELLLMKEEKRKSTNNVKISKDHTKQYNKEMREKNFEIKELQSKLNFVESQKQFAVPMNLTLGNMPPSDTPSFGYSLSTSTPKSFKLLSAHNNNINGNMDHRRHSVRVKPYVSRNNMKKTNQNKNPRDELLRNGNKKQNISNGIDRLKARVSRTLPKNGSSNHNNNMNMSNNSNNIMNNKLLLFSKRDSVPEQLVKKPKRQLWSVKPSKSFDPDDAKDEERKQSFKAAMQKRRHTHFVAKNALKPENVTQKRNSWNEGRNNYDNNKNNNNKHALHSDKVDFNSLQRLLNAARQKDVHKPPQNLNNMYIMPFPSFMAKLEKKRIASPLSKPSLKPSTSNPVTKTHDNNNNNERDRDAETAKLQNEMGDIKAKYDHLMAENQILRSENMQIKQDLKSYKAPTPAPPPMNMNHMNGHDNGPGMVVPPKPMPFIQRKSMKKVIPRKKLKQFPRMQMKKIEWRPMQNDSVKDTRWKYIDKYGDITIPREFEELFSVRVDEEKYGHGGNRSSFSLHLNDSNSHIDLSKKPVIEFKNLRKNIGISDKRAQSILAKLKKIKLSAGEIREAILNVNEEVLTRRILYDLLEVIPTLNEQKFVQNKAQSIMKLSYVEQFLYQLSDINHLELRLHLWIFKRKFREAVDDRYNDLHLLLLALKAIRTSAAFEKILSVILAFGNYMNAEGHNQQKYGIHGFHLSSLRNLSKVQSNDDKLNFLSYIYKFCRDNPKYNDCLKIIDELNPCFEAAKIKSHEVHDKIMMITEELSKFHRSLRKFRKAAIPSKHSHRSPSPSPGAPDGDGTKNGRKRPFPYKQINDQFEDYMRNFARKANLICKPMLDLWNECSVIANVLSEQYNFTMENDKIENLIQVFCAFIADLKRAKNDLETYEYLERKKERLLRKQDTIKSELQKFMRRRPSVHELMYNKSIIIDMDLIEAKLKEKEENKNILSKLIYEHAVLMEANRDDVDPSNNLMSYQRIKYLKTLAKSNELPNQASNNPEAMQKQRRRRRSLSATDIQIGNNMAMTLQEDEEMK